MKKSASPDKYFSTKAIKQNGLSDTEIDITDEAIKAIVQRYTREAGVTLNEINKIARKVVKQNVESSGKDKAEDKTAAQQINGR